MADKDSKAGKDALLDQAPSNNAHLRLIPGGGATQVREACLFFVSTIEEMAVGIFYHEKTQPVPHIACRGQGDHAKAIREAARVLGKPVEENDEIAARLACMRIGELVPEDLFQVIAQALVRNKCG